jgi:aspartyl-tRNA(Asn)/glutamyl-tRNA(Gln) amidotransferase subunit A
MTRTVADLAHTLDVIAGKDESDPWSYAVAPQSLSQNAVARGDLKGLRVAWLPLVGNQRLDTEVRRSCEAILKQLESLGVVIEEHFVDLSASSAIMAPIAGALNRHRFKDLIRDNLDKLDPLFRKRLLAASHHTAADLQQALVDRTTYFRMVQRWFDKFDVLITPTLSAPPVAADADPAASLFIDGFACGPLRTQWINYCHPFNVSGNPALTVPAGWTASNLPIGIQLVGPWFGEARLLRIAAEIEAFSPWAQKTLPACT